MLTDFACSGTRQVQHQSGTPVHKTSLVHCGITVFLPLLLLLSVFPMWCQQERPQLSPSDALQSAMQPYYQTRAQEDDLTDEDKQALTVGRAYAARDCAALAGQSIVAEDPTQLLALGKLCLFGRQFELARSTLVKSLALPDQTDRKAALLLLTRAFLGLGQPEGAGLQVLSAIRDFKYDGQIHYAADEVVAASVGLNPELTTLATELCDKQNAVTLPLLEHGKGIDSGEETVPAAVLYSDALRCVSLSRQSASATATLQVLQAIVTQSNWHNLVELNQMGEALARTEAIGRAVPRRVLDAQILTPTGTLGHRAIPLDRANLILVPFTLWSPSANSVLSTIARSKPNAALYAVTTLNSNTGGDDLQAPSAMAILRRWKHNLPSTIPVLVVSDGDLRMFHVDQYPTGIAISRGKVMFDEVLRDSGSLRVMLQTLGDTTSESHNKHLPSL